MKTSTHSGTSPRSPRFGAGARVGVLAAVVAAAVAILAWSSQRDPAATSPTATPAASAPAPAIDVRDIVHRDGPRLPPPVVDRPAVVPADYVPRAHDYGADPDPFIRQPHDYRDTPRRLGDKISFALYDLERVGDIVSRGDQPDSELARLRGPLTDDERARARAVLQAFFDEATTVVDAVLDGVVEPGEAYRGFFRDRRRRMNADLREALNLSQAQFYALWPHIAAFEDRLDQIDAIPDMPAPT